MNKIIILKNNGGRLANQLWHYAAIYSYCIEMNYACNNPSFFRYYKYFNINIESRTGVMFAVVGSYLPIKFLKLFYNFYARFMALFNRSVVIVDGAEGFGLPPSENKNLAQQRTLEILKNSKGKNFYFWGWLFANPVGIEKYRQQIIEFFAPKEKYSQEIKKFIGSLRSNCERVIGVHIRQGDYKQWNEGKFYFTSVQVAAILRDFLSANNYDSKRTIFMICSDGPIEVDAFGDLKIVRGPGGELTDLYALSLTDLIIGSNSTYGSWASYYGAVPFFNFSHSAIDWSKPIKI